MTQEKISRINELAKKAREGELTPAEIAERDALRKEYIASIRANFKQTLDSIKIED